MKKKINALLKIKSFCKIQANEVKDRVISDLKIATNIKPSCFKNPNYMSMSWDQLIELDKNPLFTVGGHSLNHNILSSLRDKELDDEVEQSLSILKKIFATQLSITHTPKDSHSITMKKL